MSGVRPRNVDIVHSATIDVPDLAALRDVIDALMASGAPPDATVRNVTTPSAPVYGGTLYVSWSGRVYYGHEDDAPPAVATE